MPLAANIIFASAVEIADVGRHAHEHGDRRKRAARKRQRLVAAGVVEENRQVSLLLSHTIPFRSIAGSYLKLTL